MPKIGTTTISSKETIRLKRYYELLEKVVPVPDDWFDEESDEIETSQEPENTLPCIECENWQEVISAWKIAMKWTDGLNRALACMLATASSTQLLGDQLWMKIIGPASCGKTSLCEALSLNKKYTIAKSILRGWHSGYEGSDKKAQKKDRSLISEAAGKCLITKDGDCIVQAQNKGTLLAESRDVYDTNTRSSYRNDSSRDHIGKRVTWLLCGTSSLRDIDQSEAGERFLDCVIMQSIDDEMEDEVLDKIASKADCIMDMEADGTTTKQYDPDTARAMQLTGGYVSFLRENIATQCSQFRLTHEQRRKATRFGKFIAYLRARPSKVQDESSEREFAGRLTSQITRLIKCLTVVFNAKEVTEEVMDIARQVTLDTARGQTMEIVDALYNYEEGLEVRAIALKTARGEDTTRKLLKFLKQIGVVELIALQVDNGKRIITQQRWVITETIRKLYKEVLDLE